VDHRWFKYNVATMMDNAADISDNIDDKHNHAMEVNELLGRQDDSVLQ
jgi:hypothetical protein